VISGLVSMSKESFTEVAHNNALRQIAKECIKDVPDLSKLKQQERDAITRPLIKKYSTKATNLGFTHFQFIYALGILTGQFIER